MTVVAPTRPAPAPGGYFVTVKDGGHGDFGRAAHDRAEAFFAKYLLGESAEISVATVENWRQ